MIRKTLITVATFAAMLMGFSYLMGVSKMDVTIKHDMQRHVVAEPYEAGDIVELSADGQRVVGILCSLELAQENKRRTPIDADYYNVFDNSQGRFVHFVRQAKDMFGLAGSDPMNESAKAPSIPFLGEVTRVVGRPEAMLPAPCICGIAQATIETRSKACVVEKSLVETQIRENADGQTVQRKTVGVSLREKSIFFTDLEAIQQLCPGLNVSGNPPQDQICKGQSGFSFDVVAKSKIGVIRERARQAAVVGDAQDES